MTGDPKQSIQKLADRFQAQADEINISSACLTSDQLLTAAREETGDHAHFASCLACAELCQKLRQQLHHENGLVAFLTAVRAEASRYEQQQGSRWLSRVWAYFAVTRSGRVAAVGIALSALLLITALLWDRASAPHVNPRFTSVFEPEIYTRAVNQLNSLVEDMNAKRVNAASVNQRVSVIRPIVDDAWNHNLTDEQRAEITNLLRAEADVAKKNYSTPIDRASRVHAADSVNTLLETLTDRDRPRIWTVVSLSVKENNGNVEKIVLKTDENAPSTSLHFEQDPATATLKTYSAKEDAHIEWQHVASFAPKQQPVLFKSGLR
jgi:hypothetical protein